MIRVPFLCNLNLRVWVLNLYASTYVSPHQKGIYISVEYTVAKILLSHSLESDENILEFFNTRDLISVSKLRLSDVHKLFVSIIVNKPRGMLAYVGDPPCTYEFNITISKHGLVDVLQHLYSSLMTPKERYRIQIVDNRCEKSAHLQGYLCTALLQIVKVEQPSPREM